MFDIRVHGNTIDEVKTKMAAILASMGGTAIATGTVGGRGPSGPTTTNATKADVGTTGTVTTGGKNNKTTKAPEPDPLDETEAEDDPLGEVAAEEVEAVSKEDLLALFIEMRDGFNSRKADSGAKMVTAILEKFGVKTVSKLAEDKYGEAVKLVKVQLAKLSK